MRQTIYGGSLGIQRIKLCVKLPFSFFGEEEEEDLTLHQGQSLTVVVA